MLVAFELDGQPYTALNGGPQVRFNESVSFVIDCASQAEVDHYWAALGAGGPPDAQQCGWLKDRYGLSWQVTPRLLMDLLADPDPARGGRDVSAQRRSGTGTQANQEIAMTHIGADVLPVPHDQITAHHRLMRKAGGIWTMPGAPSDTDAATADVKFGKGARDPAPSPAHA